MFQIVLPAKLDNVAIRLITASKKRMANSCAIDTDDEFTTCLHLAGVDIMPVAVG